MVIESLKREKIKYKERDRYKDKERNWNANDLLEDEKYCLDVYLNTFVADRAVRTTRWSVKLARHAPLHPYSHSIDVDILV
jgi:hypothetical protein